MSLIKTSRFLLKPITKEHLSFVFEGLSNTEVTKYYAVHFNSLEATEEQIQWYEDLRKNKTGEWWAIQNKADNTFLGAIGFCDFNKQEKQIEIGYWLLPKFWKKGIISECFPVVIDYGLFNFDIHKITAYVESENIESSKLLKKHNFRLKQQVIEKNNTKAETVLVNVFCLDLKK